MLDLHAATWTAPDRYEIRDDARRFEMWESDVAARIGLGVAVDHALGWGIDAIAERNAVWPTASAPAGEHPRRDRPRPGRAALRHHDASPSTAWSREEVQARLRAEGVNVSRQHARPRPSSTCPTGPRRASCGLSVHYVTTDDELDRFATLLHEICGR